MAGLLRQLQRLGALSSRSSAPSFSAAPTMAARPFTTVAATAVKVCTNAANVNSLLLQLYGQLRQTLHTLSYTLSRCCIGFDVFVKQVLVNC